MVTSGVVRLTQLRWNIEPEMLNLDCISRKPHWTTMYLNAHIWRRRMTTRRKIMENEDGEVEEEGIRGGEEEDEEQKKKKRNIYYTYDSKWMLYWKSSSFFVRVNLLNQNKLQADSIYQIMYRKSIGGLFIGHNHVYCFRVNLVDLIAGGHLIKWRVRPWIAYNEKQREIGKTNGVFRRFLWAGRKTTGDILDLFDFSFGS